MKKEYIKPTMDASSLAVSQILSGSTVITIAPGTENANDSVDPEDGDGLSKGFNIWDDME